jgi:deoxyadenosine/deoxycytidine kinase
LENRAHFLDKNFILNQTIKQFLRGLLMYLLEGNIGVGKSTFLKLIQKACPEIFVFQEPQENWASQTNGQSLLENFYKDAHRWAYTIETLALISRIKNHITVQKLNNSYCLMERSVYSGHFCFAQNGYANGFLSALEWDAYERMVDVLVHQHCQPPHGFIYLRAQPEICFERIQKRHRKGEESMTFDYVAQIGAWHEKFFIEKTGLAEYLKNMPILILDANFDVTQNSALFEAYAQQVKDFMYRTQLVTSFEHQASML